MVIFYTGEPPTESQLNTIATQMYSDLGVTKGELKAELSGNDRIRVYVDGLKDWNREPYDPNHSSSLTPFAYVYVAILCALFAMFAK